MVLVCHVANSFASGSQLASLVSVGGRGVDLFFVLSGWLLGSQLVREYQSTSSIRLGHFWQRRWLRTLPAYYAVLFATFAQFALTHKADQIDLGYLVFVQNYYYPEMPYLGVTWSLCVEEHFYLLVAPILLVSLRFRTGRWLTAVGVLALIGLHIAGVYQHRADYHIRASHILFEQCGTGVLLAVIAAYRPAWWARCQRFSPLATLLALALIVVAIFNRTYWNWYLPDWGTGGWALIFAAWVLLANSSRRWQTMRRIPLIEFVALRAYSVYLVHTEAIVAAGKLPISPGLQACVAIILSFALAELLYRIIEKPFMSLRKPRPV